MPEPRAEGLARVALRSQPARDRLEPAQSGDVEQVIETLVGEHSDDLPIPLEVLVWGHQLPVRQSATTRRDSSEE